MLNWAKKRLRRWLDYGSGQQVQLVGSSTLAGIHVDEDTSLGLAAVWCAVGTISSLVAGLPLGLYRHMPSGGKAPAPEHPLHELLRFQPNPEMAAETYWEALMLGALIWGNGYAEIERDEAGRPVALWPLDSSRMKVGTDEEVGRYYEYRTGTDKVYLRPDQVYHIMGLSKDGCVGLAPIQIARESLGLTRACESFGASFFGNSAKPSGVLQHAGQLSDNARENLRRSFEAIYSGSNNTGRTALLEEGVTFTPLSIPAEDAQFLQTRQYQVVEVARIFRISPVFLHDLARATWANLETLNRQLVQLTLRPWLARIEAETRLKLLSQEERPGYFAEHDVDDLLRADVATRYASYATAITAGWLLRSEVRAEERLDPIEGLDTPTLPSNVEEQDGDQGDDDGTGAADDQGSGTGDGQDDPGVRRDI